MFPRHFFRLVGFIALLACGAGTVWAQPGKVQISFILIAGAEPVPGVFMLGPQKSTVPVKLIRGAKSAPQPYDGPSPLTLFAPAPDAPGGRWPLVKVPLPSASRLLVLLAPGPVGPGGEATYTGMAVDDDLTSMPPGSVRFLNYSGKSVTVKVGEEVATVAKGPSKAFNVVARGETEAVPVIVEAASLESDGTYHKSYSGRPRLRANERQTFILLPPRKADARGITVMPSADVVPGLPAQRPAPTK
ncbi:MAG: hypothetical protein EAZ36_01605 [Verrucomicrobia bacterium]|nr:MAG: hypothetical protein EAZ36_01605 [Verrucomicrobiota bacterium]